MSVPAPEDITKWYELITKVFGQIIDSKNKSKKRRYQDLKRLYDIVSDVYIDYSQIFEKFDRGLPNKTRDDGTYVVRSKIVEKQDVLNYVQEAKLEFNNGREKLSTERLLWKDKAAGWFRATNDDYEKYFLFAVYWFLEYRDDYDKSSVLGDEAIDFKLSAALERGGSAVFDTPSHQFSIRIAGEEDPSALRAEAAKMRLHLSEMFRFVIQKFRELEENWQVS